MMITALMMVAAATVCAGANDAAGQSIVNARAEFNRAIAERDIGAVSATLAEAALRRYLNLWEMAYDRHRDGLMSAAKWNTWSQAMEAEATYPPTGMPEETWEGGRVTYGEEFARYVDAIYAER
jgi:hypothetical protein